MNENDDAMSPRIYLGQAGSDPLYQAAAMSNRHGLITGATGTGKTVTLQRLAEGFAQLGVPVLAADIKGDLSGLGATARRSPAIDERLITMPGFAWSPRAAPVMFWDVFGEAGCPVRTTPSEMGPRLLANLLRLNEVQEGVLYSAFRIADDQGLLLLDLKDLRALLAWMSDNASALRADYGTLYPQSIGAIQRRLQILESQGAEAFFGEPALALEDLLRRDDNGHGLIHLVDGTRLVRESPRVYAAFLMWLLAELFEQLPEVGDPDRPVFVLFFDEAHLLFEDAPRALLDTLEQVVRLIRSKGVGVYFVTQSPLDIPEEILGQLGLKIQHALRAFTPKDRKAVRAVADNFRANPDLDVATAITELGVGEALVSPLDASGVPQPVARTLIAPPMSRIGPLTTDERATINATSPLMERYRDAIDRESAYEQLQARTEQAIEEPDDHQANGGHSRGSGRQTVTESFLKSVARSVGRQLGRQLVRGVMGSLLSGRR